MNDDARQDGSDGPVAREGGGSTGEGLAGAVRTVSGLTLLSRLGGLARDVATVRVFGDTAIGSAFAAAFLLPNLFRRLFGEGALAAAFLPVYSKAVARGGEDASRLASLVLRRLALVTGAITLLGEVVLLALVLWDGGGAERSLSFRLMMVMLPFMPLVCLAAILGAMLQVHGRFGPAAGAPILLNVFMIAGAMLHFAGPRFDAVTSAYLIGALVVVSGLAQVLWCARALRGYSRTIADHRSAAAEGRAVLRGFVPVAIGLGAIQLNTFLDTLIAMWPIWVGPTVFGVVYPLDEASNAILGYTQRLYQFPLGVFGIAVATAAFPMLTAAADDPVRLGRTLARAIRLSLFIGLPASAGLVVVRHDLVYTMFGGGAFSDEGVGRAANVLTGYAFAVWAYGLNHVFVRVFYAKGDMTTPMRLALASVGVNIALNLTLMWSMREAGLAWATAFSQFAQTLALAVLVRRHVPGGVLTGADVRAIGAMAGACLVMALAAQGALLAMGRALGWWASAARLGVCTAAGGAAYVAAARALRVDELRTFAGRLAGRATSNAARTDLP
ncbi:MAG: murein biosynthesis integral membrane protein MurJ [Phycisphaerales bacterium]|nr:murein biosynthesis integral membrane protein MurJ [Phycisphaerales bacterium]